MPEADDEDDERAREFVRATRGRFVGTPMRARGAPSCHLFHVWRDGAPYGADSNAAYQADEIEPCDSWVSAATRRLVADEPWPDASP